MRKCAKTDAHSSWQQGTPIFEESSMAPSTKKNSVMQKNRLMKMAFYFLPTLLLAGVFADDKLEFWEKKDSSQWSQKECKKLLEDSPWVKHHVETSTWSETPQNPGNEPPRNPVPGAPRNSGPGSPQFSGPGASQYPRPRAPQNQRVAAPPVVTYSVQLRSARPIAQAVERLSQITGQPVRPMGPGGRGFGPAPGFGPMGFPNPIIVHIKCTSNNWIYDWSMFNYWTKQTVEGLKDLVTLSGEKGAKVSLIRYVSPFFYGSPKGKAIDNEFDFIFLRQLDGKEILSADDEFLELSFPHPNVSDNTQGGFRKGIYDLSRGRDDYLQGLKSFTQCSVKFKTGDMKFQGGLVY
jgi:hypothetical protein